MEIFRNDSICKKSLFSCIASLLYRTPVPVKTEKTGFLQGPNRPSFPMKFAPWLDQKKPRCIAQLPHFERKETSLKDLIAGTKKGQKICW